MKETCNRTSALFYAYAGDIDDDVTIENKWEFLNFILANISANTREYFTSIEKYIFVYMGRVLFYGYYGGDTDDDVMKGIR